ncbi:DMT family transporter [Bacillus sp. USDA818B3_A]|uniref:DMT family transporter n=1 Tax=Bacillus sp. USDA818B3_A TaxID=2698834 RepID=UPI00136F5828|nr:EamA family transporter [Bacillus sp. USDA818B3_A]
MNIVLLGILFTILWASGAVSVKFGLLSSPPLTMGTIRFILAGILLLLYIYGFRRVKYPLPHKREWKPLILLGFFNTSLYLGCGFWALQTVSSGFFNLAVVVNPFLVALLSSLFGNRSIQDQNLILYLVWSVIGVSIFAMILWFYLPIAGYLQASILLGERINTFNVIPALFVFAGLYLSVNFRLNKRPAPASEENLKV